MSDIGYSEKDFENYIVSLLSSKSGYIHGSNNDYNPQKSILAQTFISFVKSTQLDNWTCLCDKFDTEQEAEEKLIDELIASRKSQGTLDLLRKGFTFRSIQFDTVYWKPENNLNPETIDLYKMKKGELVLKNGKKQPDSSLRDTENVPLKEDIKEYFKREVLPFAPDAWIDEKKNVVGYEIPFTRNFYKYEAPKPSAQIMDEIKELEKELAGSLTEIFGE